MGIPDVCSVSVFRCTFLMLGIMGEYIGKAILNLNSTPQFIVREKVNILEKKEKE